MMKQEYEQRQSRATTHFKFYSEKYLWGSSRSELLPDERAVWVDFLCLATMNFGDVICFSRDTLAAQLAIDRELLNRSIEKFIKYGKVKRKLLKKEEKEVFTIIKWNIHQADYLKKRAKKAGIQIEQERIKNEEKDDAETRPTLQERRGDYTTQQDRKGEDRKGEVPEVPPPPATESDNSVDLFRFS